MEPLGEWVILEEVCNKEWDLIFPSLVYSTFSPYFLCMDGIVLASFLTVRLQSSSGYHIFSAMMDSILNETVSQNKPIRT